jgi:choline dehydrogenase-like flavoprotein
MIEDLDHLASGTTLRADVCIIGSGAAGLTLARQLLRETQLSLVVLESGGEELEAATQELYRAVIATGAQHFTGDRVGRYRMEGGSTTRWAGLMAPLAPLDFEARDWVAHSGWPIAFDELSPWYARASEFVRVDWARNDDRDLFRLLNTSPPSGFDPERVAYQFCQYTPDVDFRRAHRQALANADRARAMLLRHANVTAIELSPQRERAVGMRIRSLAGKSATVSARFFLLCTGGIENARILLHNRIAAEHDQVGRFFQDHPKAVVGVLQTSHADRVQRQFQTFYRRDRQKFTVRLSAPPGLQRERRILNIFGQIEFDHESAEQSPERVAHETYTLLRRGRIGGELARRAAFCLVHAPALARPLWEYLVHGRGYNTRPAMRIVVSSEQEPHPQSRITLADDVDALGIPRAQIQWRLTDLCGQTIRLFARTLSEQFRLAGLGEIELADWLGDESRDWRGAVVDQYHHIGATRMSLSPADGVVDPTCRVHGIDNLYIGGSSVFPTSGAANPTLTVIALAMRLADEIRRRATDSSALVSGPALA